MSLEQELGLSLKLMVAGFAGGAVNAITFGADWRSAVATVIVGMTVANYLGGPLSRFVELPEPVGGFICGMAALVIVNGIIGMVQARFHKGEV